MSDIFDFAAFPLLESERLRLRRLQHEDAAAMLAIHSNPDVRRYLDNPPTETIADAVGLIDWQNSAFTNRSGLRWGITLRDRDVVMGTCGVHHWDQRSRRAEIGYELHPDYWRQGYMTEAVHVLARWCFLNLNLHRLEAECVAENSASARVLEKVGFTLEGVWRERSFEHGHFVDLKQYGLLRREYLTDEAQ